MRSKRWDGCCNGHLHRWTALSATVPAHSNTSRHLVGGRKGHRLMKPPGWVVSGQDLHETGDPPNCKLIREFLVLLFLLLLLGGGIPQKKKKLSFCVHRLSQERVTWEFSGWFYSQVQSSDESRGSRRQVSQSIFKVTHFAGSEDPIYRESCETVLKTRCDVQSVCEVSVCASVNVRSPHLKKDRWFFSHPVCVYLPHTKPDPFLCLSSPCPKKIKNLPFSLPPA